MASTRMAGLAVRLTRGAADRSSAAAGARTLSSLGGRLNARLPAVARIPGVALARGSTRAVVARGLRTSLGRGLSSSSLAWETAAPASAATSSSSSSASADPSAGASAGSGEEFADPRAAILEAALLHVEREGWSERALALGAEDVGFPPSSHGMFPRGGIELVEFVMTRANEAMAEALASREDLSSLDANARIHAGVRARLEFLAPYLPHWPQAIAISLLPQNALSTAEALAVMADELWYRAGDRSTDISWYTRRALLLGVYSATELFMLTDTSPGYEETWAFLDRRLADVVDLGRGADDLSSLANLLSTTSLSLAGGAYSVAKPFATAPDKNDPAAAVRGLFTIASTFAGSLSSFLTTGGLQAAVGSTVNAGGDHGAAKSSMTSKGGLGCAVTAACAPFCASGSARSGGAGSEGSAGMASASGSGSGESETSGIPAAEASVETSPPGDAVRLDGEEGASSEGGEAGGAEKGTKIKVVVEAGSTKDAGTGAQ